MITCPACGKENDDSSLECKRCRAPLREDAPAEEAAGEAASSSAFGAVCPRCEAYNEPGTEVCTNCGLNLTEAAAGEGAPLDKTPEQPYPAEGADHTPPDGTPSFADEAVALSPEEAAEAGIEGAGA